MSQVEHIFSNVASGLRLFAEISSVVIVGIGLGVALYFFIRTLVSKQKMQFIKFRISLGRFLVVALEFQLAADIIGTAVAPSWQEIAQVGAIASIRVFLNYFLNLEIKSEEKENEKIEIPKETKKLNS